MASGHAPSIPFSEPPEGRSTQPVTGGWAGLRLPARLAVFAVVMFLAAVIGHLCTFPPQEYLIIWPPAGILFATFLLEPRRNWPIFALITLLPLALFEAFFHGHGILMGLPLTAALTAQSALGASLTRKYAGQQMPDLTRIHQVGALAIGALLGPVASATIGAVATWGEHATMAGQTNWAFWWATDALGVVVFAPLILVWNRPIRALPRRHPVEWLEMAATFGGLLIATQVIFGSEIESREILVSFPFFTIPFLFWIAIRFHLRGTVLATAAFTLIIIANTSRGLGPFPDVGETGSGHAFLMQTLILVCTLSSVFLASTMADRKRGVLEIRQLNQMLERRVLDRTAELEESERRFQTLAETAPVGIFSTDPGGRCVYVNDHWCETTGLSAADAIGTLWLETVDDRDRPQVERRWDVARTERRPFQMECRLMRPDKHSVWVSAQAVPALFEKSEDPGYIGTITDINERKLAEGELEEARQKLEERVRERTKELSRANAQMRDSETRIRSVIDSAPDAFIATDARGSITEWNARASAIFGHDRGAVMGRALADAILPANTEDSHRIALHYLFSTGQGSFDQADITALRANGESFAAEISISAAGSGSNKFYSIFIRDITERKQAENEVRENESVLRSFFDSTPVMMGLVELLNDDIIHVSDNNAAAKFFGTTVEALAGTRDSELGMSPTALRLWVSHYRESQESGKPLHFGYTAETPNGPRDLSVTVCYATQGPTGRPRFAYAADDVTERRLAEEDLNEKTAALENAAEGIARIDSQGRFMSVNRSYADLTGYHIQDLENQEWLATTHPEDRKMMKVAYQTMLAQGKSEQEVRGVRKDGTVLYLEEVIVSTYDPQGNFVGHYCFVRDITSRKRAEIERDRFFTLSLDMLCIIGMNGYFRRMNPSFEATLGFSLAELQATPFINFVHPDDRERTVAEFDRLHRGEESIGFENRYRCKDGSFRWFSWTATPYAQEEIIYAVARDVTERKRVEQEIIASLEEKDILLKEIHHRVKNNLQVISSLLQLQSGYIKDKKMLESFRESQNRIRSMAMIHEKLYQTESLARIDFEEYAGSLCAMLIRSYSTGSSVRLQTDIEKVSLNLDTAVPVGLITNELVSNALKYAFPPGHDGAVTVSLHKTEGDGRYALTIQDDGIGLPANINLENASSLGLRLVKILTGQIGGELTYTTGEKGTTFTVAFSDEK